LYVALSTKAERKLKKQARKRPAKGGGGKGGGRPSSLQSLDWRCNLQKQNPKMLGGCFFLVLGFPNKGNAHHQNISFHIKRIGSVL